MGSLIDADAAAVRWLNQTARRSAARKQVVGGLARWLSYVEGGLMLVLALTGRHRSAIRMLVAVGAVYVASEALGVAWPRQRPLAGRATGVQPLLEHAPERSFPSRHVASALAMAAIGGTEHPKLGLLMSGVGWTLGLSRVAAGLHYPSDVLGGALLGVIVGRYVQKP